MATEDFKRKLTAILSADVKGYSRLMGEDEEARAQAAEVLRINPNFSLEKFAKKAGPTLVSALRKAGLK